MARVNLMATVLCWHGFYNKSKLVLSVVITLNSEGESWNNYDSLGG